MKVRLVIFLSASFLCISFAQAKCELVHKGGSNAFPDDFAFGAATAAYQTEGAWNVDGKAPSAWDTLTHTYPEYITDQTNGDSAAESYYRFEQDLVALKELKVNFYRFSISWARVLPELTTECKSEKSIAYYNKIIDRLLENYITPIVTMFHFDLPAELDEKYNGFLNSSIIDYFEIYADFLYETFGDRVKTWITHNEPYTYCSKGYAKATFPPLMRSPGVADYICMDNMLRSHAKAYRRYKEKYYSTQKGKVGITLSSKFYFRANSATSDEVIERAMQYELGWLAEPIYGKTGNYPTIIISDIYNNSMKGGWHASRLPVINDEWSKIMKGSADFMGLNYFSSSNAEMTTELACEVPSMAYDSKLLFSADESWIHAKSSWLYCVPEGLEHLLKWIRDRYDNIEVIITENGWSDDGQLDDSGRIDYIKAHLQAVLNAINDGCNVTHYTYWSLMDNFEWNSGYTEKFGLYNVDMTSANKERIQKDSAKYYTKVIESRKLSASSGGIFSRQLNGSYFVLALISICILWKFMSPIKMK